MVLEIEITSQVHIIGFEVVAVFAFFVLFDLKELLQYFGCGQIFYFSMR